MKKYNKYKLKGGNEILFKEYKDVVGVDDLCEMLCVGKNTAYKLINNGKIKSIKIGRVHKIPKRFVIEYLEQAC
jgi:excisionase family DNA binding protein